MKTQLCRRQQFWHISPARNNTAMKPHINTYVNSNSSFHSRTSDLTDVFA